MEQAAGSRPRPSRLLPNQEESAGANDPEMGDPEMEETPLLEMVNTPFLPLPLYQSNFCSATCVTASGTQIQ